MIQTVRGEVRERARRRGSLREVRRAQTSEVDWIVREHADELREEVAAEVTRKRAPELVFRVERRDEQQ